MSKFDLAVAIVGSLIGAVAALFAIITIIVCAGLSSGALTIQ